MAKGPLGGDRPFVKTRLKYTVFVEVPEDLYYNPPKAVDYFDMNISAVQSDTNEIVKDYIGRIILAVNNLTHPNRSELIYEEVKDHDDDSNIPYGKVELRLTYSVDGTGRFGMASETLTYASSMRDLHKVLVDENDEPIRGSSSQHEWKPGEYRVKLIRVSTD